MTRRRYVLLALLAIVLMTERLEADQIDLALKEAMDVAAPNEILSAIVFLRDQGDIDLLTRDLVEMRADRALRNREVVRMLRDTANNTQAMILAEMNELRAAGQIARLEPLWLVNGFRVDASASTLEQIALHQDVRMIFLNPEVELITPVLDDRRALRDERSDRSAEAGLSAIGVPEVWSMGLTGEGIVIASLDTGVDIGHPALATRWRGLELGYAGNPQWAWFDPLTNTTVPQEFAANSHGTHTMGTMLGGEPGDSIGVAPGAQWIHAAVIDRGGIEQTVTDAILALQWVVDPDGDPDTSFDVPHVCNNSWGISSFMGYPPCDELFWSFLDNAEAAGVVQIFAAGNDGFWGVRRPADRARGSHQSVAVGAVDGNAPSWPIATFSSRGPTYCTLDGSPASKPDIVAPGVDVRSAIAGDGYELKSGTSMASPHVAGVVALMLQACPDLLPDEIMQIIYDTAVPLGAPGKNNTYGYGMIDAYAAVTAAESACGLSIELPNGAPAIAPPGVSVSFAVEIVERNESVVPQGPEIYFRQDEGAFQSEPLLQVLPGQYIAMLPQGQCGSTLEFFIQAEGDGGTIHTLPHNAPAVSFEANIGDVAIELIDSNDFEDGLPPDWSATSLWTVTDACQVTGACEADSVAYFGFADECSYGPDPDSGDLTTGLIALPELQMGERIVAEFCYVLDVDASIVDGANFGVVGGATSLLPNAASWRSIEFDLTEYGGQSVQLNWHFYNIHWDFVPYLGMQISSIAVKRIAIVCDQPVPCLGDLNDDGSVDVSDMLLLLNQWGVCESCVADLNADGSVDVSDLLLLFGMWGSCP